ncbi:hypothetical protein D3C71_2083230 [compost metagenome]
MITFLLVVIKVPLEIVPSNLEFLMVTDGVQVIFSSASPILSALEKGFCSSTSISLSEINLAVFTMP